MQMMLWRLAVLAALVVGTPPTSIARPNILLILADDLGFTDLRSYGSEIQTPNLDQLARQGLRFSNYHTSASCAPTRAMLLTGVDSHRAGVANIAESLIPENAHSPFYRGTLNQNVVTVATLLRDAGYRTSMSGKWHLGYKEAALRPINRGFQQTVMMPYSGADNWEARSYLPNYSRVPWFENGEEIELPEDFYSSKFLVDKAIEFIDHGKVDEKPFFAYLSFQAVHIPVQAPREFTDKYKDTYREGWNALRRQRQQAAKSLGLVPVDAPMVTMSTTADWNALSDEERRFHAKSMAVYAGMVDAMDFHIGRLIRHLEEIGEYDNTVIIFTSDNGAEASDPIAVSPLMKYWMDWVGYHRDYQRLGERGSYNYIGPSFASAAAGPLSYYKFYSGEGGIRVPLIVSGPAVVDSKRGKISPAMAFVKDLAPTILDMAGVEHPGNLYRGRSIEPMTGKSLTPLIKGMTSQIHSPDEPIAYEIAGNAALIRGDYKIMFNRGPVGDDRWHLYNIARDPGETRDLAQSSPDLLADLLRDYEQYVADNGVLPTPPGYDQRQQVLKNAMTDRFIKPLKALLGLQ